MNKKKVIGVVTSCLLAMALIAGASLIGFYYKQSATVQIEPLVIITAPDGTEYGAGWEETIEIGADGLFLAGDSETIGLYTILLKQNGLLDLTIYIDIAITEDEEICTGGLIVQVRDINNNPQTQFTLLPDIPQQFTIYIETNPLIDTTKTYGYTITMDNTQAP